jgi:hypothetical protein
MSWMLDDSLERRVNSSKDVSAETRAVGGFA